MEIITLRVGEIRDVVWETNTNEANESQTVMHRAITSRLLDQRKMKHILLRGEGITPRCEWRNDHLCLRLGGLSSFQS